MDTVGAAGRVTSLTIYGILLIAIHLNFVGTDLLPGQETIWLYSGVAGILFGTRLLNPYFVPPADAATNSFFALIGSLAVLQLTNAPAHAAGDFDKPFTYTAISLNTLGLTSALLAVFAKRGRGEAETRKWLMAVEMLGKSIGRPDFSYSLVLVLSVFVIHSGSAKATLAILVTWTLISTLKPVENILAFAKRLKYLKSENWQANVIGQVVAFQNPGLVLVRESAGISLTFGSIIIVKDKTGPTRLALALNHIGRDEGRLLRALTFPYPDQAKTIMKLSDDAADTDIAISIPNSDEILSSIPLDHPARIASRWDQICGVVDEGTSINEIKFEVLVNRDLEEGRLVSVQIGDLSVLYQVTEAQNREDTIQDRNKYGYARATARKIGHWSDDAAEFSNVNWLPEMNAPVLLEGVENFSSTSDAIGHFPKTNKHVGINISDAVTHNTAILGILGVGKSYLAIELVERMLAKEIKVICLDLTNQYLEMLSPHINTERNSNTIDKLKASGGKGQPNATEALGGTILTFNKVLNSEISQFMSAEDDRRLLILNPSEFNVWRQDGYFKNKDTSMSQVTPCGISALISTAALNAAQMLGMTDKARLCLVYEEAHSLVPEWNSVADKGDANATAAAARAILQGRKFGLGCLLITQRTANVTKTILNQCNSIFALRTFDDTGKEFLSNYIGQDYAQALPSLAERHAVFFGKASTCNNPVLLRLNDNDSFIEVFRAQHPPKKPEPAPTSQNDLDIELIEDEAPTPKPAAPFKAESDFDP